MAEYIDKEKVLLSKFTVTKENKYAKGWNDALDAVAENAIAADVAPVVHGRWGKWPGDKQHHCIVCECYANAQRDACGYVEEEFLDDYCPHCGAKMDGGESDG